MNRRNDISGLSFKCPSPNGSTLASSNKLYVQSTGIMIDHKFAIILLVKEQISQNSIFNVLSGSEFLQIDTAVSTLCCNSKVVL